MNIFKIRMKFKNLIFFRENSYYTRMRTTAKFLTSTLTTSYTNVCSKFAHRLLKFTHFSRTNVLSNIFVCFEAMTLLSFKLIIIVLCKICGLMNEFMMHYYTCAQRLQPSFSNPVQILSEP